MPQLLWQGASVYNGHLRRPLTFTCIADRLTVQLTQHVFTTWAVAAGICCTRIRALNFLHARRTF